jgi:hypothetical protein
MYSDYFSNNELSLSLFELGVLFVDNIKTSFSADYLAFRTSFLY